jgi:hypothetical protein
MLTIAGSKLLTMPLTAGEWRGEEFAIHGWVTWLVRVLVLGPRDYFPIGRSSLGQLPASLAIRAPLHRALMRSAGPGIRESAGGFGCFLRFVARS